MSHRGKRLTKTCASCRDKQIKCDAQRPCSNCIKFGLDCDVATKIRFRDVSKHVSKLRFSSDQTRFSTSTKRGSNCIDEANNTGKSAQADDLVSQGVPQDTLFSDADVSSVSSFSRTDQPPQDELSRPHSTGNQDSRSLADDQFVEDGGGSIPTPPVSHFSPPSNTASQHLPPSLTAPRDESTKLLRFGMQEACLIRNFVENLGPMFDVTDRDRHFTYVVPHRATRCAILFYAVCTASAGNLIRMNSRHRLGRPPQHGGIELPNLDEQAVVNYHNTCKSLFNELSHDQSSVYDENALAAATILRYHEQINVDSNSMRAEVYLKIVQQVDKSQPNRSFGPCHPEHVKSRTNDCSAAPPTSLGYSACLVSLRQEIWSALLNKRPFRLFSRTDKYYMLQEKTDDFEWTNHITFWCADVIRFCFGDESERFNDTTVVQSREQRWELLKGFERQWETTQPSAFKPLHFRWDGNSVFPTQLQINDCQALALQHLELGRILLAVYDPRRQHIGLGAAAQNFELEKTLRKCTLRICGLALSNTKCQASMVVAALAIEMCGAYFRQRDFQSGLLEFLSLLESEHKWPTQSITAELKNAWTSFGASDDFVP